MSGLEGLYHVAQALATMLVWGVFGLLAMRFVLWFGETLDWLLRRIGEKFAQRIDKEA